ncbi:MAG: Gfo/Idh/MocA family oxidoreductase [Candidatus Thermoplasmatota archaeon]
MRVGVIGVGSMGSNHARVYSEIADLVGIADPDVKAGGAASNRFNTSFFPGYRGLRKEPLDAVSVCVPTSHHVQVAMDVIRAGLHMLVEKPLAPNVTDAQSIVDAAKSAGLTLAVGHVERHNPVVGVVKRGLDAGQYGDLITVSARRVSSFPTRIRDVGVVMDLGVHDIDILRYLVASPVESVYTLSGRRMHERFEDHANLLLRFRNGVNGFIEVNWLTPMKVRRLSLTCLKNFVEVDYTDQSVTVSASTLGPLDSANLYQIPLEHHATRLQVRKEEPLRLELQDFLAAIQDKRPPLVTGVDAVETLKVAEAAIESHQRGKVVEVP